MGIREINQFLPAFHYGDAIGFEALSLKKFFLSEGIKSEIYSYHIDGAVSSEAKHFEEYEDRDDIKIYHFAIPSGITDFFLNAKGKKVLIHHNITPEHFFKNYRKDLFRIGYHGKKELNYLKSVISLAIGDSEYNRQELESIGFKNTAVFPLMIDFSKYTKNPSYILSKMFGDGKLNLITVGRIVANKKYEDIIKIFFYLKKFVHQDSRLFIVGNTNADKRYYYALLDYVNFFLLSSKDIIFTGHIPYNELLTYYQISDIFISMSEHEGYCLPIVESMIYDIPVIAYNSTAIPWTTGGASLLTNTKNPALVGELIYEVWKNKELNGKILDSQQKRVERIKEESNPKKFLKLLEEI